MIPRRDSLPIRRPRISNIPGLHSKTPGFLTFAGEVGVPATQQRHTYDA